MDFHNSSPWLQHQPPPQYASESQTIPHEPSRTISADTWKDQSAPSLTPQIQPVQPSLDLSDFALSDLSGEHNVEHCLRCFHRPQLPFPDPNLTAIPSSSTAPSVATATAPEASTQSYYSTFPAYYSHSPASYNTIPYSEWSGSSQSAQLPLSSYSSLNGATTTSTTISVQPSQTQQQQSTTASQPSTIIE
jgi:protein phosphatase 1 regulatory subunit 10